MALHQTIRGLLFPAGPLFTRTHIEQALDHEPHDGDIIIASYPKTGTTWVQYIVLQIISNGEFFPSFDECLHKYAPFLEMSGTAVLESLEKPRICKHHFPYNVVHKNDKAKYIYVYRNPEDTFISYYHFMTKLRREVCDLETFFENFMSGNLPYGHYFDHILSYFSHKEASNVLLVSYENLFLNNHKEVLRIAKYLGEDYFHALSENDSIMDKVLEHTSFDYMKKNLTLTHSDEKGAFFEVEFFRKGIIGDGKQSLNPKQLRRIRDLAKKKLEGNDLLKEWLYD